MFSLTEAYCVLCKVRNECWHKTYIKFGLRRI